LSKIIGANIEIAYFGPSGFYKQHLKL